MKVNCQWLSKPDEPDTTVVAELSSTVELSLTQVIDFIQSEVDSFIETDSMMWPRTMYVSITEDKTSALATFEIVPAIMVTG